MEICFKVNAQNPNVQRNFPGIRQLFNQNIVLSWQEIVQDYAAKHGSGVPAAHRFQEELAWTILSLVQKQFLHILNDDNTTHPGVNIYRYTTPHTLPDDNLSANLFDAVIRHVLKPGETTEFEQLWQRCRRYLILEGIPGIVYDEKILAYALIELAQANVIRLS